MKFMMLPDSSKTVLNIRQKIRQQRRSLSSVELEFGAIAVAGLLSKHPMFNKAKRIASFIANDSEQDPKYINRLAWSSGKLLAVPKLKSFDNSLWFVEYTCFDRTWPNKFGIIEPYKKFNYLALWTFDLVLTPVVGFDKTGNRIGMGGGFYDKTFKNSKNSRKRPKMVGIAHSLQKLAKIDPNPWDITLDAIVTEKELIIC